jgi:hypothetical protein
VNAPTVSVRLTYIHLLMFPDETYPSVPGKFRHLPVVENGEVIAILDIAKCLYDAIARMERAAEKGKAIAAAVEGVEKHWGAAVPGLYLTYSLPLLIFILHLEMKLCIQLHSTTLHLYVSHVYYKLYV